jgi:hypothetical protein
MDERDRFQDIVMAGLVPDHPRLALLRQKMWMPGTSPAMTTNDNRF